MRYLFALGMVFFGFIAGTQKIYRGLSESAPTKITYGDLLSQGSEYNWLAVSNAHFMVMDAFYQ